MEDIIKTAMQTPELFSFIVSMCILSFIAGGCLVLSIYGLLNDMETMAFVTLILFLLMVFVICKECYII